MGRKIRLNKLLAAAALGALVLSLSLGPEGAQSQAGVARGLDRAQARPGEVATVTVTPSGFTGFYAVQEDLGGLAFAGEHTADTLLVEAGKYNFIMLQAQAFTYKVKVPQNAPAGQRFTISGLFWTDPQDRHPLSPTTLTVTLEGVTPGSVLRGVAPAQASPGDLVTVTLTPSGFTGFYAVQEDLGGLGFAGEHTADNLLVEGGKYNFIMLQAQAFTYKVRVPPAAPPGSQFTISGLFWTDPQDKKAVAATPLTVAEPTAGVSRQADKPGACSGGVITLTLTPGGFSGFYAAQEDLGGLEFTGEHTADTLVVETGKYNFIMLQEQAFTYKVRVPQNAQAGQQFTLSGLWWNDPNDKRFVPPDTVSAIVPCEGGFIQGKAKLHGQADHSGILITANGYSARTDAQGRFSFQVLAGTYTVTAQQRGYLSAQANSVVVVAGGATDLGTVVLPFGDANGDNIIDVRDLALLGIRFGSSGPVEWR